MTESPFSRLEDAAERVASRAQSTTARIAYESGNRLGLLWIHGLVGTTAGVQMLLYGTATVIEANVGPWSRYALGLAALIGGVTLLVGLTRVPRSIPLEAVGLSFLAFWDGCMTVGLAWARWHQHDYRVLGMHERLTEGYVSAYPVSVYAGLFGLLVIHLWTLRLLRKSGWGSGRGEGS